ncbi:FMN-binding negative transcriptional regulator [Lysobacter changpingensis]|uniref:FMN-binding negative transcriptional regulator n=1 Tax=Lysobacter changpingensis TaxID=2792784 RepID=UPI001A8DE88A|nr:FMN-binding negative transcriptional regulator [Lysobacter changpingensis]
MYLPRAFAEHDLEALDRLARRDRFITLITVRDGEPTVSHLPVLYRRNGNGVELNGHWARSNPQATHAGPALAIFHGPHAYVSPGWYPDKEAAARVPTWNYAVAHLRGTLSTFDDERALADVVDGLSIDHEATVGGDWRFEFERDDLRRQLRGIVGFRFVADEIALKFKLSQNHPMGNRESVASQLAAQSREASRETAALMRDRMAIESKGD